ncbi:MAG: HDIG domain-containing protein [Melioribacteraceae bacterium]|nr:HDIG domain-containing protein [Melioribacteraceae bacterium]
MEFSSTTSKLKKSIRIKITLVLILVTLIVLMFPEGESLESDVTIGSIWLKDDLIADETFPIYKDKILYEREKQESANKVYSIFVDDDNIVSSILDSINNYNAYLLQEIDSDLQTPEVTINNTILSQDSYDIFKLLRRQENNLSHRNSLTLKKCFEKTSEIIRRIYRKGIIDLTYEELAKDTISVRKGKYEQLFLKHSFYDLKAVSEEITEFTSRFTKNTQVIIALSEYIQHFISPNLKFSLTMTDLAKRNAMNLVSPNDGIVKLNERIIAKHESVTFETKAKIDSYRKIRVEDENVWSKVKQYLGKFIHIVIILSIFSIYVFLFRKKVFHDNFKILLITIIFLIITFIAFIVQQIEVNAPIEFLILIPVASMLLTIMFDSRIGFYGTIVLALICGALRGNDYVFAVTNIVAGALAAYTVRDIKNRTQIFRSFLYILLGYLSSILAFGFERFYDWMMILEQSMYAVTNALISPVLTFGLIIFFERAFKITTDLTYLELSDFNHPLLKELSKNAPGTFSHSMTIGSLAESASELIGANSTLARVGAYYHDIGKFSVPSLFVENQVNGINAHEKLTPIESAKEIIKHVTRGIKLAEEYNLPQEIIDFIPMHHGTLSIQYFYEKAKEIEGEENIDKNDFRYPGPKPNTKETAIVMMADACESAVRAMTEPTPQKIENIIGNLVKYRIDDGQLENTPLTFEDISKIKSSFYNILIGQHHKRIRYPKQDELENETLIKEKSEEKPDSDSE